MSNSNNYTLGEILKVARFRKKSSISQIEMSTKIRGSYIIALEEGNYSNLPADIYVRGILKNYAEYLELDYYELLKLYRREGFTQGVTDDRKRYYLDIKSFVSRFMVTHRLISGLVFAFIVFLIGLYVYHNIQELNKPPKLEVTSPINNVEVSMSSVNVIGSTDLGSKVLINGQKIFLKDDGGFLEKYTLEEGENKISIQSISHLNNKKTIINKTVFYKPEVNISIVVESLDNTFMKIEADGEVVFEKSMDKGIKETINAKDIIKISTHNGKNTIVHLDGEQVVLSDKDEYIEKEFIYTKEEIDSDS